MLQIGPLGALFAQANWDYYTTENTIMVDNAINALLVVDNVKWVGTSWGLYSYDNTSWVDYTSELPNPKVNSISIDNIGNIYVSTLSGLAIYNGESWELITSQNSILPSHINEVVFDDMNSAYIGTIDGLYKRTNDGIITSILDSSSLEPTFINVRCLDFKGDSLCIGTINGGLGYLYNNTISWYNSSNGLIDNTATDLLVVDDNLWVSTPYGGLISQLASASFLIFNTGYFANWPTNSLNSIYKNEDGLFYIGSNGAGFFTFSYESGVQNTTVYNTQNSGLINDDVLCIEKEGSNFWIGTNGGLVKLSFTSDINNYNIENSFINIFDNTITSHEKNDIKIYSLDGKVVFSDFTNQAITVDFLTQGYYIVEQNKERRLFLVN